MKLAKRMSTLNESLTIAISTRAKELKASGKDVLIFSAGEPDFDTPDVVKNAVITAMQKGCGKYTPVPGTKEVLEAICTKLKRDNNLSYTPAQVVTSVGAKQSIFNCLQALVDEGDEVIMPAPYWVSYPEIVGYCGGKSVIINTDESTGFKMTAEQLKAAITPRTKVLMINTVGNPCGGIYSRAELEAIGKVLEGTEIIVLSDEIYEKLSYDIEPTACASVSEDMFKRTVTINGLSKCAAMPGWRFGYMASPISELNAAVKKLQSQSTANIASIVQAGAIPALLGQGDEYIAMMKKNFIERRDYAVNALNAIDGLSVLSPAGAFYLFINCKKVDSDSMRFCTRLLDEQLVACVPGVGFGMDGYFRFSFACDLESIKKGCERIAQFVKSYKKD
ncbi:MAG: pyridoxal phosphate-dependent aminotransferase [Campylobacter sp.]|nr:pyridoxal phosphate-dependent aminotransferase [Campylobacter sp.]